MNRRDLQDRTINSFQKNLSLPGDINSHELINECVDKSNDFNLLKENEPRILYLKTSKAGHVGVYLGMDIFGEQNEIYNVVECTSNWKRGIQFSYVDKDGKRYNKKNGKHSLAWGYIIMIIVGRNILMILHIAYFLKRTKKMVIYIAVI